MERRGEESGSAVSYMQIVFIVYDDFSDLSLLFLFIATAAAVIRSEMKKKENH